MPILSKPSSPAHMSLIYITVGALTEVWSGIWYFYMKAYPPADVASWYWCYGFLLTGLALLIIGLAIGQISRAARHAELPPQEVTGAVARSEKEAAGRAPIVAPVNPAAPAGPANAQGVPPTPQVPGAAPVAGAPTATVVTQPDNPHLRI
jgi:hypothetical protein